MGGATVYNSCHRIRTTRPCHFRKQNVLLFCETTPGLFFFKIAMMCIFGCPVFSKLSPCFSRNRPRCKKSTVQFPYATHSCSCSEQDAWDDDSVLSLCCRKGGCHFPNIVAQRGKAFFRDAAHAARCMCCAHILQPNRRRIPATQESRLQGKFQYIGHCLASKSPNPPSWGERFGSPPESPVLGRWPAGVSS